MWCQPSELSDCRPKPVESKPWPGWLSAPIEEVEANFGPSAAVSASAAERYLTRWETDSAAARQRNSLQQEDIDISYGATPRQTLDLHRPRCPSGALLMFVHGGYWRRFAKTDFDFVPSGFLQQGITVANVDCDLCPNVPLSDIVVQVKQCLKFVAEHMLAWGCDPRRLYVAGHCSGAHLVAMLLADSACAARIAGAHLMSGIYQVPIVRRVSVNAELNLNEEEATRNDALRQPPARPMPIVVSVGALETPGWRSQSRQYATQAKQVGCSAELVASPGCDHFSMLYDSVNPEGVAFQQFDQLMRCPAGVSMI